jgi:hypothetical protein
MPKKKKQGGGLSEVYLEDFCSFVWTGNSRVRFNKMKERLVGFLSKALLCSDF